ncbi:MAG: DJ-1/PfpI family protein [bacterium]
MGKIDGKKILIIIASNNFRDEEYSRPRSVFEKEGAKVTVVSSSLNVSAGVKGMERVKPDILISAADVSDYDAVMFVGGAGAREYFNSAAAHKIAKDALEKGKILSAICIGPGILAYAGVLKGKKATVFSSEINTIKSKGAIYTGNPVEKDGKIITADGPEAAYEFGNEIVNALMRKA